MAFNSSANLFSNLHRYGLINLFNKIMELEDDYSDACFHQNYICSLDTPEYNSNKCQTFIYRGDGELVEMVVSDR